MLQMISPLSSELLLPEKLQDALGFGDYISAAMSQVLGWKRPQMQSILIINPGKHDLSGMKNLWIDLACSEKLLLVYLVVSLGSCIGVAEEGKVYHLGQKGFSV